MSKVLSFFGMFDKIDDIIYKPIETVCEWTKEPLKRFEAEREQKAKDQEAQRKQDTLDVESRRKQQEDWMQFELKKAEKEMEVSIKELQDNQIIERNKKILDTITEYRRSMIEDAQNIANSLSHMEITLVNEAHNLVVQKTNEYKAIQEAAREDCYNRLTEIGERFANNERVRIRQEDSVMDQCDDMIKKASEFIAQLKEDIKRINDNNSERVNNAAELTDKLMNTMGHQLLGDKIQQAIEENDPIYIERK